jgi:hypothetical protein
MAASCVSTLLRLCHNIANFKAKIDKALISCRIPDIFDKIIAGADPDGAYAANLP